MNNINIDTLENRNSKIKELASSISNSASWAESNTDLRMDRDEILLLKESRMKLNRINNSFKSKPVFALFGASQVGKSYLIKNLLSVDGNPLQIILGDKSYDFLEKINPAGAGAESTGVVTRFTIDKVSENTKFPVKAKLISISDLVIILTDCFLNDIELDEGPNLDLEENIESLEKEYKDSDYSQDKLNEDNIFEIRDYFKANFKKENLTRRLDGSNYWNRIGVLISKIPPNKWVDVFSFYWDNNSEINKLFSLLNSDLGKLGYNSSILLKESSILRDGGEILDVTRVKEIFETNTSEQIVCSNNKETSIDTNRLSAVISEVTLSISEDLKTKKEFIQNTDLLDFPGARSRLKIVKEITETETPFMYLRGKISYLFKKYSTNLEINNLLFCINDQQNNVKELPSLLNDWISTNIGDSIDHRSTTMSDLNTNPLFVIFTFFNNQLTFDSINDENDLDYKWENRFIKFFQEGIVSNSYNWDTHWSNSNKLFNNFFMLRDYKYSSDTFEGYDDEGTEKSINKNRVDYLQNLKNSFINYPFVKEHFDKPTESWDASATINNDGSELITSKLLPSANNLVKFKNTLETCNIIKEQVLECLNRYHISEDKEEERNKIIKTCLNTSLSLSRHIAKSPYKFSLFIQSLQLSESEIYNVFHENINHVAVESTFSSRELLSTIYPYLSDDNSLEENIEIIRRQEKLSTKQDVIEILESNDIDLSQFKKEESVNQLGIILDKIIKLWEEKVKLNPNKLEDDLLNQILSDLLTTMKVYGLLEKIQDILSSKFNRVRIDREDEIYFASITTSLINEFVTDFGTKSFDELTASRLQDILSENEKKAYLELIAAKSLPTVDDLNNIFNDSLLEINDSFKNYLSNFEEWKLRMKIALLNNCGYVDNEQNNKKIKELLTSINNVNLTTD